MGSSGGLCSLPPFYTNSKEELVVDAIRWSDAYVVRWATSFVRQRERSQT